MARLIINPNTPQAHEILLKPGENFLGRAFANDFKFEDPSVSGSHCQILVHDGMVLVRDLGSTNGTFINRSPVKEATLQPGQLLQLGSVEMMFAGIAGSAGAAPIGSVTSASAAAYAAPAPVGIRVAAAAPAAPAPVYDEVTDEGTAIMTAPPPLPLPPPPPMARPIPQAPGLPGKAKGKSVCKFHPKSIARWSCPKCGKLFCDLCVTTRPVAEGTGHFCRACAVECTQLQVKITIPKESSFMSLLPTTFAYPFQKDGTFILVGAAIVFGLLDLINLIPYIPMVGSGRIVVRIFAWGYLFAYLKSVIHTTAYGDESEPSLPDVTDIGSDLIAPVLQVAATIILCFLPAVGFFLWGIVSDMGIPPWAYVATMAFSCLYYPMAFLAVTMFDSVGAVNPIVVIPAITKMPLHYSIACFFLAVVVFVSWVGQAILPMLIPIVVVPPLITSFISCYFLVVQCRILGLLYYTNRRELGWFSRV